MNALSLLQSSPPGIQRAIPDQDSGARMAVPGRPTSATGRAISPNDVAGGERQGPTSPSTPDHELDVARTVIYGAVTPSSPTASYTPQERMQRIDAYAGRVVAQIQHIESTREGESNIRFQKVRPFLEPAGYFSAGLLAAGLDPHEKITVTFSTYTGVGRPDHLTGTDKRSYLAWEIAAGSLEHDKVQRGGPVNFRFMEIEQQDSSKVGDLESLGRHLQDHWEHEIAVPMRDASGVLAQRSGKSDAYVVRGTLQSVVSNKDSFEALSLEAQGALKRTLQRDGQVIIPNLYGYPLAGYAFIPYAPHDGNYRHRPNKGVMIDLKNGAVHEVRDDQDFARWAANNRDHLLRSFNASDRQGGKDAHWPKAGDVLDNLIAGNRATYPGYQNLVKDKAVPVRETFNYTGSRGGDYQLKYGNLGGGIAAHYQAVNAKSAVWADQTEVFGSSQQHWKAAKALWGDTFGYVPIVGNTGTLVFGVHDSLYGMTVDDRVGGSAAAVISGLQLAHEIAPVAAEAGLGGIDNAIGPNLGRPHYTWTYNEQTQDLALVRAPAVPKTNHEAPRDTVLAPPANPVAHIPSAFPGMREVTYRGKQYFAAETPDAGDGLHYLLRLRDPDNPSELLSSGKIAHPDAQGVWRPRGVVGGNVDDLAERLIEPIGFGSRAMVYIDPDDANYVIKVTFPLPAAQRVTELNNEVALFNQYYGEQRATFLGSNAADTVSYIRMPRVSGETLEDLMAGGNALPDAVSGSLLNMLAELENAGIVHNDLAARNILYDAATQKCFPVDFGAAKFAASTAVRSSDRSGIWRLREQIRADGQSFEEMIEVLESLKTNAIQ